MYKEQIAYQGQCRENTDKPDTGLDQSESSLFP